MSSMNQNQGNTDWDHSWKTLQSIIENKTLNRLLITSGSHVPQEVKFGVRVSRMDLVSFYEEADHMIPQQIEAIAS